MSLSRRTDPQCDHYGSLAGAVPRKNVLLGAFETCHRSQWGVREVFEDAEARVVG